MTEKALPSEQVCSCAMYLKYIIIHVIYYTFRSLVNCLDYSWRESLFEKFYYQNVKGQWFYLMNLIHLGHIPLPTVWKF